MVLNMICADVEADVIAWVPELAVKIALKICFLHTDTVST